VTLTDNQYASAARKAFGDLGDQIVTIMTAVGMAESQSSGGDTAQSPGFQRGGEGAAGAFQIQNNHTESSLGIPGFWSQGLWKNVDVNAAAARKIYNGQGITAWSAYTNKAYAQYLPRAQAAVAATKGAGTGGGTSAGAQAWFVTITPGKHVPADWTKGAGDHVVSSADKTYMFAGHSNADGSGYGNISWNEGNKSASLYVTWGTDGITAGALGSPIPTKPDSGEVTPVDLLPNLSNLFGDFGPYLWIAAGGVLVLLGVLLLAKDTDIGKAAMSAAKVAAIA
jgi:hypothetical protein